MIEAAAPHPGLVQSVDLRAVLVYDDPLVGHWHIKIVVTATGDGTATVMVPMGETAEAIGRAVSGLLSSMDVGQR